MRNLTFIFSFVLFLVSCGKDSGKPGEAPVTDTLKGDTVSAGDDLRTDTTTSVLDDFLEMPLDAYSYKVAKGAANSTGSSMPEGYYHKPDTDGQYYRYFVFNQPRETQPPWIPDEVTMTCYQMGKNRHMYLSKNEMMVEFTCMINDPDLPGLHFIGMDTTEIIRKFGEPSVRKSSFFVWIKGKKAASFHHQKGKIAWWKWTHLSDAAVENGNVPDSLFVYHRKF